MTNPAPTLQRQELRFGSFQLYPEQRLLLADGQPVRLGNRAFDILLALIESAGEVVTKEQLIAAAWPDTVVEDINLRVHIAALRRALGDAQGGPSRHIVNVAGRGYSFVGTLVDDPAQPLPSSPATHSNLPVLLTRTIGRDAEIDALAPLVAERRLLTLVGSGGVGKSTLALALAARVGGAYAHGAYFVDLAAISDDASVPLSLATVLGLNVSTTAPLPDLLAFLRDKRMLFIIDNCEHVIAAAATLVEHILKYALGVDILATSREPLGAEGEFLHRLAPLGTPPISENCNAERARQFTAVQLFIERAHTAAQHFDLDDDNAATICDICRRLDGIPLAIELAASRLNLFGVAGLAARLDQHFLLIVQGRRTAAPRHQTLHAMLAWSYELLSAAEQTVLRRLAIFNGVFTVESAIAVAAQYTLGASEVFEAVNSLVEKSLIATNNRNRVMRHRLLHTTRVFAREKLARTDDASHIDRWHALRHRELLRLIQADWEDMSKQDWIALYDETVDDIRAALDWSFSPAGDGLLGAELMVLAIPLGFQLAMMDELRVRVEEALAALAALPASEYSEQQRTLRLQLETSLYLLVMNTRGVSAEIAATAREISKRSEDVDSLHDRTEPLVNEMVSRIEVGAYADAVAVAEKLGVVALQIDDPLATLLADRVMAQAQHHHGNHARARTLAESVLAHPAKSIPLSYHRLAVDRRVSMRIVLARVLWLEGRAEQALDVVDECIELAQADTPFAICQGLALAACPIALWCGDEARADRFTRQLLEATARYRIDHWRSYGLFYEQALRPRPDTPTLDFAAGYRLDTCMTIAPWLVGAALAVYAPLLHDVHQASHFASWCLPEVLRVLGEQLPESADQAMQAEALFTQSLAIARQQQALAWELRSATSLAALWRSQQRTAQARDLLAPIHARFSEGRDTRDLRRSAALLASL